MYIKGKIIIEEEAFTILDCNVNYQQMTNAQGLVSSNILGGFIQITVELTKSTTLFNWMIDASMMKEGKLVFNDPMGSTASKKIEFWDCFCVNYHQSFSHTGTMPASIRLCLSPGIVRFGDVVHKKIWHITNIDRVVTPDTYTPPQKNTPEILKVAWLTEKGAVIPQKEVPNGSKTLKLSDICYGEKIRVKVYTKHVANNANITIQLQATSNGTIIDIGNQTLEAKVKNNQAVSSPITLLTAWYNNEIENYHTTKHYTTTYHKRIITFKINVDIPSEGLSKQSLPENEAEQLKPYTYKRNFEEQVGTYAKVDNGSRAQEDNIENDFIKSSAAIQSIVKAFTTFINTEGVTATQVSQRVTNDARQLWLAAIAQAKLGMLDDRPLYWARNHMQVSLKRLPMYKQDIDWQISTVKAGSNLSKLLTQFENLSRNYTQIDFSKALPSSKKLLLMGFDPYGLDNRIKTFNPSGILALAIHQHPALLALGIQVQTCILPVRYEDFDQGIVESIVKQQLPKVDMIITTSLNSTRKTYDVEQYAIAYREGSLDNMYIGTDGNASRFIPNTQVAYTETSLPIKKIFGTNQTIEIYGEKVQYDTTKTEVKGSGGNYLSNEVMYRATTVRGTKNTKPIGHIHLAFYPDVSESSTMLKVIIEIIKKAFL
jgi:pyrrolidone-carboxylate peptidase